MKKDKNLHLRLTEQEFELIQAGADAQYRTASAYVLHLVWEDAKKNGFYGKTLKKCVDKVTTK